MREIPKDLGNISSFVQGYKLGLFWKKSLLKINFIAHLLTFARLLIPLVVAEDRRCDILRHLRLTTAGFLRCFLPCWMSELKEMLLCIKVAHSCESTSSGSATLNWHRVLWLSSATVTKAFDDTHTHKRVLTARSLQKMQKDAGFFQTRCLFGAAEPCQDNICFVFLFTRRKKKLTKEVKSSLQIVSMVYQYSQPTNITESMHCHKYLKKKTILSQRCWR